MERSGLKFVNLLLIKGVKSPRKKEFALLSRIFLVSVLLTISVKRFFVSHMRD